MDDYSGGEDVADNAHSNPDAEMPDDKEDSGEETALVPVSLFPDAPKVGDICSFKVVHTYEDEAEIQYVKEKEGDDSDGENDPEGDPFKKFAVMGINR